jgi:DNA-binding transcriptional LysR family regulator
MKRRTEQKRGVSQLKRAWPRRVSAPRERGSPVGLELRHLRTFVTLVDQGNMTTAAERLGVAQSTVSEAVTGLERVLGTRTMTRRRGVQGVDLTPAGHALLPHARSVLASLEDAYVAVAAVARDVHGSVEVIANESVSTYVLPPALGVLRQKWPNIRFAVTVGMCPSIYTGLSNGRFDVGVMLQTTTCPDTDDSLPARPPTASSDALYLCDVPLIVFAAARHPLLVQTREPQVPRERLAPYRVFVSDAKGYFHALIRDFFRADGSPGPRLEPTGSVEAVKRSVLTNPHGLGVLPAYALAEELRAGRVHALAVRPALPPVRLEALPYRTRSPMHPAVAELLDVIRTTLDDRVAAKTRSQR